VAEIKTKLVPIKQLNIPTAGTRVQVNATSRKCTTVIIQALTGNTGNVFLGDVTVASTLGLALAPGVHITISADSDLENEDKTFIDLADLYVDTATNNNKVNVLAIDVESVSY